jgi:rubrerythrin
MDIIEYALKMEQDGMAFYKQQADASTDPRLKKIFSTLVEEEARHYQIFKKLKEDPSEISKDISFTVAGAIENVKTLFEQMSQDSETRKFGDDVISAWTEALRIEEKAHAFYQEKANIEQDDATRKLLTAIAAEETRHIHMIDAVLMYLKHPQAFAASAQFSNFMSLEGR